MELKGTTIIAVSKDGHTAIAGDGQVTAGQSTIMKSTAVKVRRLYNDSVIAGFAGSVADAFTLFEKFEEKLQKFSGNLMRSSVELAQLWRGDSVLRKLEAMLIVSDGTGLYVLDGMGDVIEPDGGVAAIGSGGNFALSSARALVKNTNMSAKEIAVESINIASEICVYTNNNITVEEI